MAKLGDYRRKRRPEITNEPFGDEAPPSAARGTMSGAYVVHLHDATRRHYDLRLEVGGVLASFAVPRGLSLDPGEKHLAVNTEDHPLEYLDFEDVIPDKQYGAGPMIAWDRGAVEYLEGPAEEEIARGKLDVRLRGMKLRGRFALVKLKKSEKGNEWLLFKKNDEHADPSRDLVTELPRSVFSGLTVEELLRASEIGEEHVRRAFDLGAKRSSTTASRALFAPSRSPLAPSVAGRADGDGWVYDAELDGVRVLATRDDERVTMITEGSSGAATPIEALYPDVVRALRALPVRRAAFDARLVAFDASGHPSLALLAQRVARITKGDMHRATWTTPVVLVVTDILALGEADTRTLPLERRRELLSRLLPELGFLRAAPPLEGPREAIFTFCREHGIEGVVAKKKGSAYGAKGAAVFLPSGIAPRPRAAIDHAAADARVALRKVTLTNRGKQFWPDDAGGYTKGDLADYYGEIAEVILPHLRDRPVILVRYPDGITGKSFYQWNVPPGMPPWVRTMTIEGEDGESKRGFLVDDASTLLYIANLGCIPLHILACRAPLLDQADFFTIDFDVKQSELCHAVTLAVTLRGLLDSIGLPGFPKTSGQTGLHVLVPLGPSQSFETARALADLLGKLLVERHPEIATMERIVSKRGPKVYVDTGQTGKTRAIVAPYSVRAVPFATVSAPLAWDEVKSSLDPRAFTIASLPARVAARGDLLATMTEARPDVTAAVSRLAALVGG
jgi:bifunctional non-homologous end joining protein LigD